MDVPTYNGTPTLLSRKNLMQHDRYSHSWLFRYVCSVKLKCEISSRKAIQLLLNRVNSFEISTLKAFDLHTFVKSQSFTILLKFSKRGAKSHTNQWLYKIIDLYNFELTRCRTQYLQLK